MAESVDTYIDTTKDDDTKKVVATVDDDLIIDTVDDTPPQDRGRKPRDPGAPSVQPSDEEIGKYTENVQKRLSQMRREYHDERRMKEESQRHADTAINLAQRVHQENQKLRQMLSQGHRTLLESSKASADNEVKALQESLKAALDQGDTGRAAQVQADLARAAARGEAVSHVQPIQFNEQQEQQQFQPQPQQQQRPQLSRDMKGWMDDNPWFGGSGQNEQRMTALAYGVHQELFNAGIQMESPEYFEKINQAMKDTFPGYFNRDERAGAQSTQQRPQVASGDRQSPQRPNPKRVALTLSEKAVAKKMGISEVAYAREKLSLMEQDANG